MISIGQFVKILLEHASIPTGAEEGTAYAYRAGWLKEQDVMGKDQFLERKNAARIIHEFMRHELQEPDEIDGRAARKLQDLFDCRICVGHVIQVFVKGIMDGRVNHDGRFVFGMNETISEEETEEITRRLFQTEYRKSQTVADVCKKVEVITVEEALQYYQTEKNALLIDVRTPREFEDNHLVGAINIPLISILKNPYAVSENRDSMLLLYCFEGYQSDIAARCLLDAGYEEVRCFAWK